jgi:hypothetical protein
MKKSGEKLMKIINIKEEAERLNVDISIIKKIYLNNIKENYFENKNTDEIIMYNVEDIKKLRDYSIIKLSDLANKYSISQDNLVIFLNGILNNKEKINGIISKNYIFYNNDAVNTIIIREIIKSKLINLEIISNNYLIDKEYVQYVYDNMQNRLVDTLKLYSKISINKLSEEIDLPIDVTNIILKTLIMNGIIIGSLDSTDNTFSQPFKNNLIKSQKIDKNKSDRIGSISTEYDRSKLSENKSNNKISFFVIGMIILIVGIASFSYKVYPDASYIRSKENELNSYQQQIMDYVYNYGWDSHAYSLQDQLNSLRSQLNQIKQGYYPLIYAGYPLLFIGSCFIFYVLFKK